MMIFASSQPSLGISQHLEALLCALDDTGYRVFCEAKAWAEDAIERLRDAIANADVILALVEDLALVAHYHKSERRYYIADVILSDDGRPDPGRGLEVVSAILGQDSSAKVALLVRGDDGSPHVVTTEWNGNSATSRRVDKYIADSRSDILCFSLAHYRSDTYFMVDADFMMDVGCSVGRKARAFDVFDASAALRLEQRDGVTAPAALPHRASVPHLTGSTTWWNRPGSCDSEARTTQVDFLRDVDQRSCGGVLRGGDEYVGLNGDVGLGRNDYFGWKLKIEAKFAPVDSYSALR